MTAPLFSIVLPTFGAERFILKCLDGIREQTFTEYEILVMDGGSTDRTLELVSTRTALFDGRLLVSSKKDAGIYDAMNQGINLARGEWLYFIGADDRLHDPQVLENVAAFIRRQPDSDLVYGDVINLSNSLRYDGGFDLEKLLVEKNICHQAVFYRRRIFDKLGRYNLRYRIWADWDLNIRCFQHPEFIRRHLDLVIADFDDINGLSSREEDPEFRKLLPACLKWDGPPKRNLLARGTDALHRLFGKS